MNLIIDAGNTQIKWAFFQNKSLVEKNSCETWDEFSQDLWTNSLSIIDSCIMSSTREIWQGLAKILEEHSIPFFILNHNIDLPIKLEYHTPETLGLDRIAGAAGAFADYPGEPILVIDMGTAITYDFITAGGSFRGGNISPGLDIRFKSLNRFTDNLPLASFKEDTDLFGQSTMGAIEAGVQTGIYYEVMGYINTLKNKYNGVRVILTGGASEYFVRKLKKTIFVDPNLVLKGLNHILEYQKGMRRGDDNIMSRKNNRRSLLLKTGLFLILSLISTGALQAQDQTSSPYSRFGIGELLSRNFGRGESMGGLGIGLSEKYSLNLMNPAGIGRMDTMQFLFELGGSHRMSFLKTSELSKTTNNTSFSYLAMGFPVIPKFWKASVGIMPYSGVGYFMSDTKIDPLVGEVSTEFAGDGGVSQFYLQNSFRSEKLKFLSLGFTLSYLFGPMTHSKTLLFPEDSTYFSTRSQTTSTVGGLHMTYGAQLYFPIKKDYFLNLGGVFENQSSVKTRSRQLVYATGQGISDTLFFNENANNSIVLPMAFGGGVSFGKENKFTVGVDYRRQNWEDALFLGQQDSLANSQELIVGFEYIPDAVSPLYYYKRMSYRAGVRYGKSFIQLQETQLNDFGITFGVGLPVRAERVGRASLMNISAELGKRGTIENNLISEFYALLSLQFTLRDFWFMPMKYN